MRAMNRLLESVSYRKYKKYIERDLLPAIERYLGFKVHPALGSDNPYGCSYKAITTVDGKYINIILMFTTNDRFLNDHAMCLDLVVNGRSYPSYINCDDVQDDIDACSTAFDKASRDFDIDISLDDTKFEQE